MANKNSKKSVIAAAALALVGVLAVSYVTASVVTDSWNPKDWVGTEQIQSGDIQTAGGAVIGNVDSNGIKLTTTQISTDEYATYGVSASALSAFSLTATITPISATNKAVTWSCAWANPSSAWASGKAVSDYYTITPTSTGALTATAACLKQFGEPIIITVTSQDNTSISATATADYVKRISYSSTTLSNTSIKDDIEFQVAFNTGTLTPDEIIGSASINMNPSLYSYLKTTCGWTNVKNSATVSQYNYGDELNFSSLLSAYGSVDQDKIYADIATYYYGQTNVVVCSISFDNVYTYYNSVQSDYYEDCAYEADVTINNLNDIFVPVSGVSFSGSTSLIH